MPHATFNNRPINVSHASHRKHHHPKILRPREKNGQVQRKGDEDGFGAQQAHQRGEYVLVLSRGEVIEFEYLLGGARVEEVCVGVPACDGGREQSEVA